MDGILLENSSTVGKGVWDMKFGVEFGSGAEPITGPFQSAGSKDALASDAIRLPLEIRYGLSDRSEVGWQIGLEMDKGRTFAAGSSAPGTYFDQSGLQRIRMFGKWKLRPRLSWMVNFDVGGNNTLVDGNDGLDFGVKFMYGPRIGAGQLLMNLGVGIKAGNADFNNNGVSTVVEGYDNPIGFGVGYVYPFTNHFTGMFELLFGTSQYEGGAVGSFNYTSNNLSTFLLGFRYGWSDRFSLTTGIGTGILAGSPNLDIRLGLNWLLGDVKDYAALRDEDYWSPSEEMQAKNRMASGIKWEPVAPEETLAARTAKATQAFDRGDYVAAATHYEGAVAMKRDDAMLNYNLATTYFIMRRYSDANPYYRKSAELNPNDVDGHLYLGYTYYYMNDPKSAAREWRRVLEIDPDNALARDNLNSLGAQ